MTKAQAEARHFHARLLQRYGITVNHRAYWELCREAKKAPLILKESWRLRIFLLVINGRQVPCIFDGLRGRLLSSSYSPPKGHPKHEPMLAALRRLFDAHAENDRMRFDYATRMYYGRLEAR